MIGFIKTKTTVEAREFLRFKGYKVDGKSDRAIKWAYADYMDRLPPVILTEEMVDNYIKLMDTFMPLTEKELDEHEDHEKQKRLEFERQLALEGK
jgi:hypothetical protein